MCEKVDNWCMEEKRGCKGCYFEDNKTLHNYIVEDINITKKYKAKLNSLYGKFIKEEK